MWEWLRQLVGVATEPLADEETLPTVPPSGPPGAQSTLPHPFALDLEQLAVRADWLSERGDPRGLLINAELAGHPNLDRLVTRHLPAVLGPLLTAVEVLEVRYGRATEVCLRRLPSAAERDSEAWANLDRIDASQDIARALNDARVQVGRRRSRVPQRFVPYLLVRSGLDRQLWLAYDTFSEQPVMIGVPDPDQVIEPDETGLSVERVIGAEIYPVDLEPIGPQPWPPPIAAVVGDADPAQWVLVDGVPTSLGATRPWRRPRCCGSGWAGMQSRGSKRTFDEDGYYGDGKRFLVLDGSSTHGDDDAGFAAALTAFAEEQGVGSGIERVHRSLADGPFGASAVAAQRAGDSIEIAWTGDARAYRVTATDLQLLTSDHTLVQQRVDAGLLSLEDARTHRLRGVLTRSVGHDDQWQPDFVEVELEPNERLLLCTDGLWRTLSDEVIFDCIRDRSVHDAVEAVVRRANAVADDNLTVLLIEGTP